MTEKKTLDFSAITVKSYRSASIDQIAMPCEISPAIKDAAVDLLHEKGIDTENLNWTTDIDVSAFVTPFLSEDISKCWLRLVVDHCESGMYAQWIPIKATPSQVRDLTIGYMMRGGDCLTSVEIGIWKRFFEYIGKNDNLGTLLSQLIHENYGSDELSIFLDGRCESYKSYKDGGE
jgi:hypothetical protein